MPSKLPSPVEQQYRSLFEHNLDAVFSVDLEGRFTDAKPWLGSSPGMAWRNSGKRDLAGVCPPEDLDRTLQRFQQALQDQHKDLETSLMRKDGRRVELLITGDLDRGGGADHRHLRHRP